MIHEVIGAKRLLLTLLAVTTLLAGCKTVSDTYDGWFGSAPKQKPAELVQFQSQASLRIVWQANVGAAGRGGFYPSAVGNTVYAAGASGQIAGFAANSGASQIRFEAATPLSGGVGTGVGLILAGTAKGEVLAYALQQARRLARLPAGSLRGTKALMRGRAVPSGGIADDALLKRIQAEVELFCQRVTGPATGEAIAAFKEKRKPDFAGKD